MENKDLFIMTTFIITYNLWHIYISIQLSKQNNQMSFEFV